MDKITHYQNILSDLLAEYSNVQKTLTPNVKSQIIIDRDRNQFQLLSVGWHGERYVYTVAFHFVIIENKIWLQQNNTDILIADELVERGVPKSDIVLGFIAPEVRAYSGFAAA
jgi:XisI protein